MNVGEDHTESYSQRYKERDHSRQLQTIVDLCQRPVIGSCEHQVDEEHCAEGENDTSEENLDRETVGECGLPSEIRVLVINRSCRRRRRRRGGR